MVVLVHRGQGGLRVLVVVAALKSPSIEGEAGMCTGFPCPAMTRQQSAAAAA